MSIPRSAAISGRTKDKKRSIAIRAAVLLLLPTACAAPAKPAPAKPVPPEPAPEVNAADIAFEDGHDAFRGLDLTKLPRTSRVEDLPEVFEQRPPGSLSFEVRRDVVVDRVLEGTVSRCVYYVPAKDLFYVQSDSVLSSNHTYFGPIHGHPRDRLEDWR